MVLKDKYYPMSDFMNSNLKYGSSYAWQSIWGARKVLSDGFSWCVGNNINISTFNHKWLSRDARGPLVESINNCNLEIMVDLINS